MPLQEYIIAEPNGRIGLWRMTEEEDFFTRKMPLLPAEQEEIDSVVGWKKVEKLTGKYLMRQMTGWAYEMVKDEFGKPFFRNTDWQMSISHSGEWVAGIVSKKRVGIDIQYLTKRLEGMAWRVMNDNKLKSLDPDNRLEHLHVYWGAKEALYKAYGRRGLDFRKHILIEPFEYPKSQDEQAAYTLFGTHFRMSSEPITEGVVLTDSVQMRFDIYFKKIGQYILVYAIEQ
jgi:phosphopantetheinyl transferase